MSRETCLMLVGILRQLVRNYLKTFKQVGKMTDEHADRGGAGVTVVQMK